MFEILHKPLTYKTYGEAWLCVNVMFWTHFTCNRSGKSCYLRMIGTIVVLAHIGCYVPAVSATIPVVRNLLTRKWLTQYELTIQETILMNT